MTIRRSVDAPYLGRAIGAGGLAALTLGYVAARTANASYSGMILVVGGATTIAFAVTYGLKRLLLIVTLLGIPFEADKNYSYNYDAAAHGALGGISLSITTLALFGLYALWTVDLLLDAQGTSRPRLRSALPAIGYLAVTAVSLVVAQSTALAWNEILLITQGVLLFVYISSNVRSAADFQRVVHLVIFALTLQASFILLQYYMGFSFDFAGLKANERIGETLRTGGTIGSPNTAASFLAPGIAMSVALLVARSVTSARLLAALSVVVGSFALVLTFSRGGWLACAIAVTFVLTALNIGKQLTRRVLLLTAIVALLGVTVGGQVHARLESKTGGAKARVALGAVAVEVIRDHPVLGVGANNYVTVLEDYAPATGYSYVPHNKFLLVWSEAGLAGLIAFGLFLGGSLRKGWLALRAPSAPLLPYVVASGAAYLALLVHMNFEPFHGRPQVMLLFLVTALIYAAAGQVAGGQVNVRERPGWAK